MTTVKSATTQKLAFNTKYCLMQVKSIAECSKEHSIIPLTFIKLQFSIKTIILSIFKCSLMTGFTVFSNSSVWVEIGFFEYRHIYNLIEKYNRYFELHIFIPGVCFSNMS